MYELVLTVFDATGKIPDGIFDGNLQTMGGFYSCMDVDGNAESGNFLGKYCLVNLTPSPVEEPSTEKFIISGDLRVSLDRKCNFALLFFMSVPPMKPFVGLTMKQGFCLPDSCTDEDVYNWLKGTFSTNTTSWEPFIYTCQSKSDAVPINAWYWVYL